MRKGLFLLVSVVGISFSSCQSGKEESHALLTAEKQTAKDLDSLKKIASAGDLIVRLGDDMLSYQIKFLNEKDQSYSHAGMIVEKDNQKLVAHIAPDDSPKDVIQYIPIDSFLNPAKNLYGALYRYNFSPAEKDSVAAAIENYRTAGVQFDRLYDLETDDKMYCSEMISKAIGSSTNNRIQFRNITPPPKMMPLLVKYFEGKLTGKTIASRKMVSIDNLYKLPDCEKVMDIKLKALPGQ